MSFTPNIVNIHRTILHVLALHRGGGEKNLVYFTRTPQKREERGEERAREKKKRWRKRSVKLHFQGCEVILSLVESSVLVDRPFFFFLFEFS